MVKLKDSIEIKATAEEVYNGLIKVFSYEEYFKKWHRDHIKCYWIKGKAFDKGSIVYVEEYVHGKKHKMKFIGTNIELNRKIEYRLLFPISLICPKGSFIIEPIEKGCIFTANLYFRFGRIFDRFARYRANAVKNHMKEEGENLKTIVEK